MQYRIIYSRDCEGHLRALPARDRVIVLTAVEEQLTREPTVETRHRKLMRPNPLAPWELRVGELRVFYDVEESPEPVVNIAAIGVKDHNVLRIEGKVFPL